MTDKTLLADSLDYLSGSLAVIASDLSALANIIEKDEQEYHPRGTILKATPDQVRFKPKSMWVSQGDGTYKHITGKKGLVTTHDRLDGYTDVIFSA
jgi:hypothetical protein